MKEAQEFPEDYDGVIIGARKPRQYFLARIYSPNYAFSCTMVVPNVSGWAKILLRI
jgi:hypothetical protein